MYIYARDEKRQGATVTQHTVVVHSSLRVTLQRDSVEKGIRRRGEGGRTAEREAERIMAGERSRTDIIDRRAAIRGWGA